MKRTNAQMQSFIDELHKDVHDAFLYNNMTVEKIAKIMHLSPKTIMQMIQTYQERRERGTVA